MKLDKDSQEKIQELQVLEQNLQNILLQKQAFQLELSETDSALSEIAKTGEDVYRIVGSIMIKASKEETEKELKEKSEILAIRLKSIEKQESDFREKSDKLRQELLKEMKKP